MSDARGGFNILPAGDACLLVVFDERIDPEINARCVAVAEALQQHGCAGVRDVVPTYHTVAIHFDPRQGDPEQLRAEIERELATETGPTSSERTPIDVPVCYGGEFGPDLSSVAAFASCSEEEVIRLHAGAIYRVYMLGFMPGFAYLGQVRTRIAAPRLPRPRPLVPARSVGIAGRQTGIYPIATPGGWQLIGRAAVTPFDPGREMPFLFKPGDTVRFLPIARPDFHALTGE